MKLLFSIPFVFLFLNINAQDISEFIIGEWEIIYFETEHFKVDKGNNSVVYSEEYQNKFPILMKLLGINTKDSLDKFWIEDSTKGIFEFTEKGIYKRITDGEVTLKSKYKIIPEKNRIKYKYSHRRGPSYLLYKIEDKYLHITLKEKGNKFILQKLNSK